MRAIYLFMAKIEQDIEGSWGPVDDSIHFYIYSAKTIELSQRCFTEPRAWIPLEQVHKGGPI